MNRTQLIYLMLTISSSWHLAHAQTNQQAAKMDTLLNSLAQYNKLWGSVAIRHNGQTTYTRATGYAWDGFHKANPETLYRIGSITKVFTSVMVQQLAEEGKIKLEAPISNWFPDVPNAQRITLFNLLQHSSGLHNFTDDEAYIEWMTQPQSQEQMLQLFAEQKPDFEPGTRHEYSNTNYLLLGFLIEKIDKRSYDQSLQARIAKPLGLKYTRYGGKIDVEKNEAQSYRHEDGHWIPETETDMSVPHGAGAIVSTPAELCIFYEALFEGKLLTQASLARMCDLKDGYGLGIFQVPFHDKKAWFHNGSIDGFLSNAAYFPAEKVAVAFIGNAINYDENELMVGLLSYYFEKPYTLPNLQPPVLTVEQMQQCVGSFKSADIPLKLNIMLENKSLKAQATGQSAFALEVESPTVFHFKRAGIEIIFEQLENNAYQKLVLNQGGQTYHFTRE